VQRKKKKKKKTNNNHARPVIFMSMRRKEHGPWQKPRVKTGSPGEGGKKTEQVV